MYVGDGGRKLEGHLMIEWGHVMITDAKLVLADIADGTSIFHGIDKVLIAGDETFECPTEASTPTDDFVDMPIDAPAPTDDLFDMPIDAPADNSAPSAAPTLAPFEGPTALSLSPMVPPEGNETNEEPDSSASFCGIWAAVVAVVTLSTLAF
ncbi:MAG: hypothetical protein SGBAC_009669 [Bacillariaceae sp.]